jgi:hypothetical protein
MKKLLLILLCLPFIGFGQEWEETFLSPSMGNDVQQTSDGGYIITGERSDAIWSLNGAYLLKVNNNGIEQWSKDFHMITYLGHGGVGGHSVQQTSDGGYIIAGGYTDTSTSVAGFLIKTDGSGDLAWETNFVGLAEGIEDVFETSDGGFIVTCSDTVIKTDINGNYQWSLEIDHYGYSIIQTSDGESIDKTSDGGYIITGTRTDDELYSNVLLTKTDGQGNLEWEKTFDDFARGNAVQQTSDGGYIIAGSMDNSGIIETYLIKTNSQGNVTSTFNIPIKPNRKLEKTVDILGKQTKPKTNTPLIEIYDDGTVEKRIVIE